MYRDTDCEQLHVRLDRVDTQAIEAAAAVDRRFADNTALLMVSGLFWPAALGLRANGAQAERLARLRGEHDAIRDVIVSRPCPRPAQVSDPLVAQRLELAPGDRFVYQSVVEPRPDVTVEVSAVRGERVEFEAGRWAQDLAGNRLPAPPEFEVDPAASSVATEPFFALPYVVGLLRRDLAIGQNLHGMLQLGKDAALEVEGQVVALGPATLGRGTVPTATLELEGRLVETMSGNGSARRTIPIAMVVDSRNGMLVRLQLKGTSDLPATDVRLVRIDRRTKPDASPPT